MVYYTVRLLSAGVLHETGEHSQYRQIHHCNLPVWAVFGTRQRDALDKKEQNSYFSYTIDSECGFRNIQKSEKNFSYAHTNSMYEFGYHASISLKNVQSGRGAAFPCKEKILDTDAHV